MLTFYLGSITGCLMYFNPIRSTLNQKKCAGGEEGKEALSQYGSRGRKDSLVRVDRCKLGWIDYLIFQGRQLVAAILARGLLTVPVYVLYGGLTKLELRSLP
jgi:hypothetical protein